MAGSGRWIRLDVTWDDSEWLDELPWHVRAAWTLVLCHVKAFGDRGVCDAPNIRRFCQGHNVPQDCVEQLVEAAVAHGAMSVANGEWRITEWRAYQESDSAERMRRMRGKVAGPRPLEATASPVQGSASPTEQGNEVTDCDACDVTPVTERHAASPCHATETETETETESKLSVLADPPSSDAGLVEPTGPGQAEASPPTSSPPIWWFDRYPETSFPDFEAWWDEFSRIFPPRAGDRKLKDGREVARRLLRAGRGDLPERILAGLARYRDWCEATGKLRTEYVQQVPTWLRAQGWDEPWEIPDDLPPRPARPARQKASKHSWREDLGIGIHA